MAQVRVRVSVRVWVRVWVTGLWALGALVALPSARALAPTLGAQDPVCAHLYRASPGKSVDEQSFKDGATLLGSAVATSSADCLLRCCARPGCHLALVEEGFEGNKICHLLSCWYKQRDVCALVSRPGFEANVKVGARAPTQRSLNSSEVCSQPPLTGPCRASFHHWHYSPINQTCLPFIYGGCLGNGNNFVEEGDCQQRCGDVQAKKSDVNPTPQARMLGRKDCVGVCSPSQFRCNDGCCVDSGLLCDGTPHCADNSDENFCGSIAKSYERLSDREVRGPWETEEITDKKAMQMTSTDAEYCFAPPDPGFCRAAFPRWFYDVKTQNCARFTYGGCRGNRNNYSTREECLSRCAGRSAAENESGNHDKLHNDLHHHPKAIGLMVVLGGCVLTLLLGVVYFLAKLVKRNPPVSPGWSRIRDDKEILFNTVATI